jgi:tRNA pseudouridine13 synthase
LRGSFGERASARLRASLEDFSVFEILDPQAPFEGEHRWLRIRKAGLSTPAAARRIADLLQVDVRDVGYSGLKDERSISEQWFSVPAHPDPVGLNGLDARSGLQLVRQAMQPRKLRRGLHSGNRFQLVLREVTAPTVVPAEWRFPNAFGSRRFGTDNVERAVDWLAHRRGRRISRFKQGIYLSVLRSLLFNEVLAARIKAGNWASCLPGDVVDASGFPTGPLWGRGRSATRSDAALLETAALESFSEVCEGLDYAGVDQARRSFVGIATDVAAHWPSADRLELAFTLATGSYATTALAEFFVLQDEADR